MTSLQCESFREPSILKSLKMPNHIFKRKGFLYFVSPFMCLTIATLCKYLVTSKAVKWSQSCVSPFVCFHMATLLECSTAF